MQLQTTINTFFIYLNLLFILKYIKIYLKTIVLRAEIHLKNSVGNNKKIKELL